MENDPFEDVFPIENGDFPLLCLITGVYQYIPSLKLTGSSHPKLSGWLEDDCFLLGWRNLAGANC